MGQTVRFAHLHETDFGQVVVIKQGQHHDPAISVIYRVDGITVDAGSTVGSEAELNQLFDQLADPTFVSRTVESFNKQLLQR